LGDEKGDIKYAKIPDDKSIDTITLEEALDLLKWPRNIGEYKKLPVEVNSGKFGPYVKHDGKFYSITIEPDKITLDEAIEIIKIKEAGGGGGSKAIKEFGDLRVLDGKYGHYINNKKTKKNYKIPEHFDIDKITKKDCEEIISETKYKKTFKKKK
jgi:DNA topoisomerase-1